MAKRTPTIEHVNASLARWKTRLKRAMTAIEKLERQKRRIEAKAITANIVQRVAQVMAPDRPKPEPVPESVIATAAPTVAAAPQEASKDQHASNLDIPTFLRREKVSEADKAIAEAIKAEAEAKRVAKSRGRIATMKAKKAGDTKRMPLSGRAALDMIRNG